MSLLSFIKNKIWGDDDKNKQVYQAPKVEPYKPSLREEMQNYARSDKWDNNAAANVLNQGLDRGYSWERIADETGFGLNNVRDFSRATRPNYGIKVDRPDQSFANKLVDIFSANTEADKYRRAQKGNAGLTINDFVKGETLDKTPLGDKIDMWGGKNEPQEASIDSVANEFSKMSNSKKRAYVANALSASQRGDISAFDTLRALASKGQLNEDATNISSNPLVNATRSFGGGVMGGASDVAQGFSQTPVLNSVMPLFLMGNKDPHQAMLDSIQEGRRIGRETQLANSTGIGKGVNIVGNMAPILGLSAIPGAGITASVAGGFGQGTGSIYNTLTDMGVDHNKARLGGLTAGAISAVPAALGAKGMLDPVGLTRMGIGKIGNEGVQKTLNAGLNKLAGSKANAFSQFLTKRALQVPLELGTGAVGQIGNNIGMNAGGVSTNIFENVPEAATENLKTALAIGTAQDLLPMAGRASLNKAKQTKADIDNVGGLKNYLDFTKDPVISQLRETDKQYARAADVETNPKVRDKIVRGQADLHKQMRERIKVLEKKSGRRLGSGPIPDFSGSKLENARETLSKAESEIKPKVTVKANQSEPPKSTLTAEKTPTYYHGTRADNDFDKFDFKKSGTSIAGDYGNNVHQGNVAYFTKNKDSASIFAREATDRYDMGVDFENFIKRKTHIKDGNVLEFKPAKDAKIKKLDHRPDLAETNKLKQQGYDGVEFDDKEAWTGFSDGRWRVPEDTTTVAVWNTDKLERVKSTPVTAPIEKTPQVGKPDPTAALPADVQEVVSAIHDSINKGDYTQAKILKESMGEYAPNIDIPSVAPPKDNSIGSILKERQQVKVQTNKTQELSKRYGVTERTIQTLQKRYGEDNTNNILASTSDATNIRDMNHFVLGEARKRYSNNKEVTVKNNQVPDAQISPEEFASLAKTAPIQEGEQQKPVRVTSKTSKNANKSSLINEKLWATEFDTPMPKDMTYKEFSALRDNKWTSENAKMPIDKRLNEPKVVVGDKSKLVELDKTPGRPAEVSGVTGEVRPIHQQIKELPSHENLTALGAAEVESFNDNFNKHILEVEQRVGTAKLQKMADDIFNSKNGKFPDPKKIPADSKALYNKEFKQIFGEMSKARRSEGGEIQKYYFPETIETTGDTIDLGWDVIRQTDAEVYGSNIERKGTAKLESLADPVTRLRQAKDQFLADKYGDTEAYAIHRTSKMLTERLQRNTQETGEVNITKDLGKSKAGDRKINKTINEGASMINDLKNRIDNQAWDIGAAGFGKRKIINKESRTSINSADDLFAIGKKLGRKQVEINTRSRTSDITIAQKLDDIKVNNDSLMRAGGYGQFRDADAFAGTHIKASIDKNGKLNIKNLKSSVKKYITENYNMSKTDIDYLVRNVGDINGKSDIALPQEVLQSKLASVYQEAARAQMIDLLQTTKFTNKKVNHMVSDITNQILATSKIDSTTANTVVKNILKTQNTLFRRGNVGSAINEFSDMASMLSVYDKDFKIGYDKNMLKVMGVDGQLDPSTEAILQTVTDTKSAKNAFIKLAQKGASGLDFYKYVEALKASTVLKTSESYWSKKGYSGDALTQKILTDYRDLTLPIDMFTKTALDSMPLYTQYRSWQLRNTQKEFNLARGTLAVGKMTDASRTERIIRNAAINIPAKTAFWLASNGLKGTAILTAFGLTDYTGMTDQDYSGIDDKDKSAWDKTGGKLADMTTTGSLLNAIYQSYEKEKLKKQYENAEYNPYHNNDLKKDITERFIPQQIKNIRDMQEVRTNKYSTNRDGKVQYLEPTNPLDVARGYLFGKRNTQAGRDYTGNKDVITRVKEGKNPIVAVRDMAKEQLGAQDKIYNRPLNNSDYANYSGKVKDLMKKGDTEGARALFDGGRAYNHTLDDLMRTDKDAYDHYIASLANTAVPPEKWRERVIRDGKIDYTVYDMLKKREKQRIKDMGGDLNPLYDDKLTRAQLADLLSDKATETGKDIASRNLLWKEKWYQDYKAREKEFYDKNPYADGRELKGRQKEWQDLEDFRNTLSQTKDSKTGKEMAWVKDYPLVAQYKNLNDQYGFDSPEVKSFFKNNYDNYKTQRDAKNAIELATINKMREIEGHEPMSDSQFAQAKNVVQEDKTAQTGGGSKKSYSRGSSSSKGYLSNSFVGTIKGDLGPAVKLKYSSGGKVTVKARSNPKVASVKRQKARM